jgi:hypothetical protein
MDLSQVRTVLNSLKMINYYPAQKAQTNMWRNWDPQVLDRDFTKIAGLHVNTVRLALFPEVTGFPEPAAQERMKLAQAIEIARSHGLRVKLTLFGFFDRFADTGPSKVWVQSILGPYQTGRDVACVDLFNELDLTRHGALEWVREMATCVRDTLGGHVPVTISVSNTAGLRGLRLLKDAAVPIDFWEFHYYGKPELAWHTFQEAKAIAGQIPLFIGETGYSTNPSSHKGETHSREWWEAYQGQYLRTVAWATYQADLPLPAPWVYSDFAAGAFPPHSKGGADPGEYAFGLCRVDGTPKPAADAVAAMYGTGMIDLSFNNGFELADPSGQFQLWQLWQPHSASFARDTGVAHSGMASACIRNSASAASGEPAFYLSPIQCVVPGHTYVAGVWARGHECTGLNRLTLAWFDDHGKYLRQDGSRGLPGGTCDWVHLTATGIAPRNAGSVQIHLTSKSNRGSVWFDDVTFAEAGN